MLTKIRIRNFKRLDDVEFELGNSVVLIGPNNSGKTTALQALTLWHMGLSQWLSKREGKPSPDKRPGVSINRLDLFSVPVPSAKFLWHDSHTRRVEASKEKQGRKNIRIDVIVDGISDGKEWSCGFEFDYMSEEHFVCRPIRKEGFDDKPVKDAEYLEVPDEASKVKIAFLPPMSGLVPVEPMLQPGRINVLLGQGQTAQVLRNLCYQVYLNSPEDWETLRALIDTLFGVKLQTPIFISELGEIRMEYKEHDCMLDISASGRGLQQTLLLLAYLYANKNTVLLLDEPDAHLEILRQRQIYELLTKTAERQSSQIIIASHSEVLLNEAADRDVVVAFVGKPHRIDDRGSQLLKSLRDIGFEHYYQAEQTGWVLYLEGSTDLAMLKAFAEALGHEEAMRVLARPYVQYVGNSLGKANEHFWGLREAKSNLVGIALFDRFENKTIPSCKELTILQWKKKEFENHLCIEEALLSFARGDRNNLFAGTDEMIMRESIAEIVQSLNNLGRPNPWSGDLKATDDFLNPLFSNFYRKKGVKNLFNKSDYHTLIKYLPTDKIDSEIRDKLDAIVSVSNSKKEGIA